MIAINERPNNRQRSETRSPTANQCKGIGQKAPGCVEVIGRPVTPIVPMRDLPPRRAADTGGPRKGRAEPRDKGSRPQRTAPVPWMREEGAGGGLDKMGAAAGVRVVGDKDVR